jgi:hypothetical protein
MDQPDDAWPSIEEWIARSPDCRVLGPDMQGIQETMRVLELTPRSLLGAFVTHCGGLLLEGGWLRILGAGGPRIRYGLLAWNTPSEGFEPLDRAIVVAHDAVGGFFAINGGGLGDIGAGNVYYLAPDTLEWQDLGLSYTTWLQWMITTELEGFYERLRWPGWEAHMLQLNADQGISVWPPLFAAGPSLGERSRRVVSAYELWAVLSPLRRQMTDAA